MPVDQRTRNVALALAASLVAILWGTIAKAWFTQGDINIGLAGIEVCQPYCELRMWTDAHAPTELTLIAATAFLGGLNAAGFGCHAFAMLLKGKRECIKTKTTLVFAISTVAACIAFLLRIELGRGGDTMTLSYPPFLAIAGNTSLAILVARIR